MPALLRPHSSGAAGSRSTRSINFAVGTALELAEFLDSTRCVLNSASTKRGNVTSSVVSRTPIGLTESSSTRAL